MNTVFKGFLGPLVSVYMCPYLVRTMTFYFVRLVVFGILTQMEDKSIVIAQLQQN